MKPKKWNPRHAGIWEDPEQEDFEFDDDEDMWIDGLNLSGLMNAAMLLMMRDNKELLEDFPITEEEIVVLKKAADPKRQLVELAEKILGWVKATEEEEEIRVLPARDVTIEKESGADQEVTKEFSKMAAKVLTELDKISKKIDEIASKL